MTSSFFKPKTFLTPLPAPVLVILLIVISIGTGGLGLRAHRLSVPMTSLSCAHRGVGLTASPSCQLSPHHLLPV